MTTAYFEFILTPVMSALQFEMHLRRHIQGINLKRWSQQQKRIIYQVTTQRPEDLIKLGMALQIVLEHIGYETDDTKQPVEETPIGGCAPV